MGISANPANRGQLVETFINSAYDKVETVHDNLAEISRVADLSGSRQAGTSFPTTRADGSALISGDTFFNIDTNNHYTWNAGSLSWVAQGSATTTVETITVDATMASTGTITLSNPYILGSNNLLIFVQGVYQGNSYTETNTTTIDFGTNLLEVGDTIVSVVTKTAAAAATIDATNVNYTSASAVVSDAQTKLREFDAQGIPVLVSALPDPTTSQGVRSFVNDASSTMTAGIGAVVVGGGSNVVPVYSDGTNWRIG